MNEQADTRCSLKQLRRMILDMYETHPPIVIAEMSGRSVGYVRCVASAMGIRSGGRGKNFDDYWTESEEKMVAERYGSMTVHELARHLGRTPAAVAAKASRLGLGRRRTKAWTKADDALLVQFYETCGSSFVSARTGRTREAVKHRARKLGLRCTKAHPWRELESKRYAQVKARSSS